MNLLPIDIKAIFSEKQTQLENAHDTPHNQNLSSSLRGFGYGKYDAKAIKWMLRIGLFIYYCAVEYRYKCILSC